MNDFDHYYLYKLKNRYIMASITDHVIKLQELTQRNLEILQTLNDSFFTNQNHLSVMVGGNHYAIPSFISLENKINSLAANFENLVNAPETGEAFFDFNGNTRAIQVRSYTSTPNSLVLDPVSNFHIDNNDIFKDFLTPNPYINLNVQSLPNDTTQVLVKKVIPLNTELKHLFTSKLTEIDGDAVIHKTSIKYPYKDLYKVLDSYVQDVDYIEYDTKVDLPIRKNVGSGTYVIEEILEDVVDENLDNYILIKFRNDVDDPTIMSSLKYRLFDETIEKMLKVGDELVTFEGNAKLEITEIRSNTNTVKVKVLHGEFLNLVPSATNNVLHISPLSKIKFYSPIDFDEDKYVRVPLEEDQYVFVAVAALNSRMNIQSAWGSGLMLNTYALLNDKNTDFKTYYEENVRNVGDILFEITAMMSNTLTKYTKEEYDEFSQYSPIINTDNLQVVRINEHLNNSLAVQNIRSLYSQKLELQTILEEINTSINDNNDLLAAISFDDTTGQRTAYTDAISKLKLDKNNTLTSLTKIMNEIALAANNSELPIENAKYRIRGFFDTSEIEEDSILKKWGAHIKGIRVQYRYKNVDAEQNQALTISDKFVYSDWNEMESTDRVRIPIYENGMYKSMLEPKNDKNNEPSFNQIDIPISQGETIDIRLKVVYDFGAPFVETTSKWSPVVNIGFPQEFLKDIKILDIIEENNNDIESNRFSNIIKEEGIPEHISDKIKDQDITYFHKPENIASGFYTAERRIIPLKDKLTELTNLVTQLQDEIMGTQTDQLTVSIKQGNRENKLTSFSDNYIYTEAYKNVSQSTGENNTIGNYEYNTENKLVTTVFYISLKNDTQRSCKLYSLFPNTYQELHTIKNSKYDKNDYILTHEVPRLYVLGSDPSEERVVRNNYIQNIGGVWMEYQSGSEDAVTMQEKSMSQKSHLWMVNPLQATNNHTLQTGNQFIYFRTRDVSTQERLYGFNQTLNVTLGTFDSDKYEPVASFADKNGKEQLTKLAELTCTSLEINQDTENILSGGACINIQNEKEEWVHTLDSNLNDSLWYGILNGVKAGASGGIMFDDKLAGHHNGLYVLMDSFHNIKYEKSNVDRHGYSNKSFMFVYPKLNQKNSLQIQDSNHLILNPNDEILIPIVVEYNVNGAGSNGGNGISKTLKIQKSISFDILTSLYQDPTNYKVTFVAKYEHTDQDKIMIAQQTEYNTNTSKYNVIYK